jgi:hypothetical protein
MAADRAQAIRGTRALQYGEPIEPSAWLAAPIMAASVNRIPVPSLRPGLRSQAQVVLSQAIWSTSHLNWTNPRACLTQSGPDGAAAALFAVSLKLVQDMRCLTQRPQPARDARRAYQRLVVCRETPNSTATWAWLAPRANRRPARRRCSKAWRSRRRDREGGFVVIATPQPPSRTNAKLNNCIGADQRSPAALDCLASRFRSLRQASRSASRSGYAASSRPVAR